jgi:hypothetical protein
VYDAVTPLALDEDLGVDVAASEALGAWYAFVAAALDGLVGGVDPDAETPSSRTLWPEHFDLAVDLGADGARANYGGSPGDDAHAEPYLYVGPWEAPAPDDLWNATSFPGALLAYDELLAADEPLVLAARFFARAHRRLVGRD